MKALLTAKHLLSVLALLLAITMLFSACGGTEGADADPDDDQTESQDDGDNDDSDDADDDNDADDNDDQNDNNSDTSNGGTNNGGTNNGGGSTLTKTTNAFSNSKEANIWKNVPKKEVHLLMWKDGGHPTKSEQKLISQYEKMTGVNIRVTTVVDAQYTKKLVSLISGKDAPDVVKVSSYDFPGIVTKAVQPLKANVFQLNSDCWNKTYMDAFKINGNYYGVAMPYSWSCEDATYATYYNVNVLRQCGVTTMPYQLYEQGKWNWDTQNDIISKVRNANKGYTALSVQSYDLFMHSAGVDFVSYNGKSFVNNLGSIKAGSTLVKAWQQMAEINQAGSTSLWAQSLVEQGKVGLFSAITFGMFNEGGWFDNAAGGVSTLQAVPLAGPKGGTAYTPVRPKCWGIAKGAKNPEGAAYFLRYFLDTSALDMSSTFYNKQFETVYNKITSSSAKKTIMYGSGVTNYITPNTYQGLCKTLGFTTPANIQKELASAQGTVNAGVSRANKDLLKLNK